MNDRRATETTQADQAESFETAEALLGDREDRTSITKGLAAAVIAQEVTRMTLTKSRMILGAMSDVDRERLIERWRVLADHYQGSKYQGVFETGVDQLQSLTSEEANRIVSEIRRIVEPTVNHQMEELEIPCSLAIPGLRTIKLNLTVKGHRVSVHRFQKRMLRFIIGSVLWLSAFAGTAHWVMWTIFGTRYLAVEFEDPAKFVQLVLLLPATLFAWVVGRNGGPQFVRQERKLVRASLRTSIGLLIAGAWVYWFVWVFDGLGEWVVLEATTKIVQPLFLLSGFFAAWLVGRPSTEAATMEAGQSNGGVS